MLSVVLSATPYSHLGVLPGGVVQVESMLPPFYQAFYSSRGFCQNDCLEEELELTQWHTTMGMSFVPVI